MCFICFLCLVCLLRIGKYLPPLRRSPSLEEGGLGGFASSRSSLYNSGCRVATLLVSKGVMGFLGDLRGRNSKSPPNPLGLAERVYSFHRCGGSHPSRREVWGFAGQGLRPCRRLDIGALRSPLSPFAPSRNLVYNPGCRVATLLVLMGVMGFLGNLRGRNRNLPLIP